MRVRVMLDTVLKEGKLTPAERDIFAKMYDQFGKCGRITRSQGRHLVEVFEKTTPKVAMLRIKGVSAEKVVTSLAEFENSFPNVPTEGKNYEQVKDFFERGGVTLTVRPVLA